MLCAEAAPKRKRKQPSSDAARGSKPPFGAKASKACATAPPGAPLLNGNAKTPASASKAPAQTDDVSVAEPRPVMVGAVAAAAGGVPKAKAAAPAPWPLHAGLLPVPQRGAARAADARLKNVLTALAGKADDTAAASNGGRDDDPALVAPPVSKPASKPRRSGQGRPPKSRPSASAKGALAGAAKSAPQQRNALGVSKGKGPAKGKASKQKTAVEQPAVCSRGRPIADVLAEQKVRVPSVTCHCSQVFPDGF